MSAGGSQRQDCDGVAFLGQGCRQRGQREGHQGADQKAERREGGEQGMLYLSLLPQILKIYWLAQGSFKLGPGI